MEHSKQCESSVRNDEDLRLYKERESSGLCPCCGCPVSLEDALKMRYWITRIPESFWETSDA